MSKCKIYIKFNDIENLWSDIFAAMADAAAADDAAGLAFATSLGKYIESGKCKAIDGDNFRDSARSSCKDIGDVNEVRPIDGSTTNEEGCDNDQKKWFCFKVDTDDGLPPPEFQAGNTIITSTADNLSFSNQTESWSDIWDSDDYMDMVGEYSLDNINNLYVSEKVTGTSVTTYKIDIGSSATILVNSPWSDIMNSVLSDKIDFYVEIDNTETQYLLEPDCWGPDNPCENQTTTSGDSSSGDSTANNTSSSNSVAIILVASIGGFLLLMLIITIIFVLTRKKPSPSVQ